MNKQTVESCSPAIMLAGDFTYIRESTGDNVLWLHPDVMLRYISLYEHGLPRKYPSNAVQAAFDRFNKNVFGSNIVPDKLHPRGAAFEPEVKARRTFVSEILVQETRNTEDASPESYAIQGSCDSANIRISITAVEGAIRGFDTLTQLFYAHSSDPKEVYTAYAPFSIKDAPHFSYRGLMLDISRNWIPPADVKRTIDAMGFNKLNKLHLHATDSQSWPLEIPSIPALARDGAYRADYVWTVKDLEDVQRYALYRGVEVILEIDMPGHTGSVALSHPHLITAYNARPWNKYAAEPPAGQFKLKEPKVHTFVSDLLHDILSRLSPFASSFHIGGDELNKECYALDPTINSSSKSDILPHLQKFMAHATSMVEAHDLTPHVWEDMLLEWDIAFPSSTIIHAWRAGSLAKILEKDHYTVFGEAEEWYLDTGFGTFLDPDPTSPDSPIKPPYPDWCPPYKNWRRILAYDPLKHIAEDKKHLVLGGEIRLWSELTDPVTLDQMVWPRAAAAGEMLWRGKGEVGEEATRRLAVMRERLVARGVRAGMVQMEWGLRNKGLCVL